MEEDYNPFGLITYMSERFGGLRDMPLVDSISRPFFFENLEDFVEIIVLGNGEETQPILITSFPDIEQPIYLIKERANYLRPPRVIGNGNYDSHHRPNLNRRFSNGQH